MYRFGSFRTNLFARDMGPQKNIFSMILLLKIFIWCIYTEKALGIRRMKLLTK